MTASGATDTRCPYCGQRIGQAEIARIKAAEDSYAASVREQVDSATRERIENLEAALAQASDANSKLEQETESKVAAAIKKALEDQETLLSSQVTAQVDEAKFEADKQIKERDNQLARAQKTIETLQRQLDEKPSYTRGGMQEEELVEKLRQTFPRDRIARIVGRSGADIEHEVFHDGSSCGVILYESKNVQNWNADFVDKLLQDKVDSGAAFAVLVSTAFPAKARDLHFAKGIPIVRPELLPSLVSVIRQSLVDLSLNSSSQEDRGFKLEQLMTYLSSPDFKNKMENVIRAVGDLEALRIKERRAHERHWDEEVRLESTIRNSASDVQSDINGILAGRS